MVENSEVHGILESALHQQIDAGCPTVILHIKAPRFKFSYSGASGEFARGSHQIQVDDCFRIASVTKAVTAAAAMRLVESGRWNLDEPVTTFLPAEVIDQLCRLGGFPDSTAPTIRMLLAHRSGIPDYFFDKGFQARVAAEPNKNWRPEELVASAANVGAVLFTPGSSFSYGDTAYVLIGVAIEKLLGCSLADAYRTLIFNPLNMERTYLEFHEPARAGQLSHHYEGDRDLRETNLSFDWGGGGLVSDAGDLSRFLFGLFEGPLLTKENRDQMLRWRDDIRWRPHSSARYLSYGLGVGKNVAFGQEIVGVTGVWGAFAYYWPAGGASITGTLNSVGTDRAALMDAVLQALVTLKA